MDDNQKNEQHNSINRRRFMQLVGSMTAGGALLAACGTDNTPLTKTAQVTTTAQKDIEATIAAAKGKTYFPGENPEILDAFTAPIPLTQSVQYVPGKGGKVTAFTISFKPAPVAKEQNKYWQELNKKLNVDWNVIYAPSDTYAEKATALIAGGDVPDLFLISMGEAPGLITPIKQGAFTDLTKYLSGSALKDYPNLSKIAPAIWNNAKRFGKIYAIPRMRPTIGGQLFIRYDWMQKVGITDPKNMDDFFKLCQEITKAKPDGKDTYALGSIKSTNNFFYECYRMPNEWQNDGGKLTNKIEVPQFKDALETIKKFWNAGVWHPDSFTYTTAQNKQGQVDGKFAAYWDGFGAYTQRSGAKKVTPTADIRHLLPFGYDGGAAVHYKGPGFYGMAGIPTQKGGDPERVKELLRIMDYLSAPTFSIEGDFLAYGIEGYDNTTTNGLKVLSDVGDKEKGELVYIANGPQILYFTEDPQAGPLYQETIRKELKYGIDNPCDPLYSDTATKQSAKFKQVNDDYYLKIIKGELPVSAGVDSWIKDWKAAGGDKMRQEYQDALAGK
jgi:putative aldouronate transport system substrate-binding protein